MPADVARAADEAGLAAAWLRPIVSNDGGTIGALLVWRGVEGPPLASHRITLDHLGQRIGLALDFDRSHQALAVAATRDPLTNSPNRAEFERALKAGEARPRTNRAAVFYLDLDGFKELNDTLGHHVGGAVLCEVSDRIRQSIRVGDVYARLGGDEFAAMCPTLDSEAHVSALAERLIEQVGRPMVVDGVSCSVGTSVGIAVADVDGAIDATLVVAADAALRRAKQAGRGRWELSTVPVPPR